MIKAYIVTLGLLVSFSSFANFKIETLNVKETGKDLSTLIPEGTEIGDCIVRQSKFYSDKEYVIVVKKKGIMNSENAFQFMSPSKYKSDDKTLVIRNIAKYENFFSKTNREFRLKVKKLNNGTIKVIELFITSTSPSDTEDLKFNVGNSIGCVSRK